MVEKLLKLFQFGTLSALFRKCSRIVGHSVRNGKYVGTCLSQLEKEKQWNTTAGKGTKTLCKDPQNGRENLCAHIQIHSNFDSCGVNTPEVFLFFGHGFLGCASYNLKIWQDLSPMFFYLPIPIRGQKSSYRPQLISPNVFETICFHDYYFSAYALTLKYPLRFGGFLAITRDHGH